MTGFFILWFSAMFPLVFSPGPANIVFAASGLSQGVKRSISLLVGIDLMFLIKSFLIGFGLGEVFERYPNSLFYLQLAGAIYLCYLAYKFAKPAEAALGRSTSHFGFRAGIILQLFNAKGWVLVALMFSLFSASANELWASHSVWILITMLACLNVSVHLIWIMIGASIGRLTNGIMGEKIQNIVYALSLLAVACWLLWDAVFTGLS